MLDNKLASNFIRMDETFLDVLFPPPLSEKSEDCSSSLLVGSKRGGSEPPSPPRDHKFAFHSTPSNAVRLFSASKRNKWNRFENKSSKFVAETSLFRDFGNREIPPNCRLKYLGPSDFLKSSLFTLSELQRDHNCC